MTTRKVVAGVTAGVALGLASMSAGWACGSFAATDMTLKNATDEPWDGPGSDDVGKNWSDCAIGRFLTTPHGCSRPVTVDGKNFENNVPTKEIAEVRLYWLDEPYYFAGVGSPNGPAEQLESKLCETKGVYLGTAPVGPSKTFSTTVTVPPTKNTTEDGTLRLGATGETPPDSGKFYYGLNAICAVWDHTVADFTHQGSIGNGYNLYF